MKIEFVECVRQDWLSLTVGVYERFHFILLYCCVVFLTSQKPFVKVFLLNFSVISVLVLHTRVNSKGNLWPPKVFTNKRLYWRQPFSKEEFKKPRHPLHTKINPIFIYVSIKQSQTNHNQ